LYVLDDTFASGGSIDDGWILFLKTAPAIAPIGPVTTSENTQVSVPVLLSDATVNETNWLLRLMIASSLFLISRPTSSSPNRRESDFDHNANYQFTLGVQCSALTHKSAGTNVITITAKDPINNLTTVSSFVLTVLYVNQSPTVTTATNGVYVTKYLQDH
jgi:hypothetical protein